MFEALGQVKVGVRRIERGGDDNLLLRADKGANSRGAAWIFGEAPEDAVLDAVRAGEIDTLLVLGDALDPDDTAKLDDDVRSKVRRLLYVGPFIDAAAEAAAVKIPSAAWAEEDGTFVNFEGRIQRLRRAHRARGEGRPGWRVVADLALAAGCELPEWGSAGDVLAALSGSVAEFAGVTEDRVGMLGVATS